MFEAITKNLENQMEKALKVLRDELAKIRTGRASPALLDSVRVSYYGTITPLNQMASITTPEARLLVVQPWDLSAISEIEKAILKEDLGVAPQNDGKVIRIPIPPLTEERRKELVKLANKFAEECRVAVRNVRRNGMDELKRAEKEKKLSEDEQKRGQTKIQEMTDAFIKKIDTIVEAKAREILEV